MAGFVLLLSNLLLSNLLLSNLLLSSSYGLTLHPSEVVLRNLNTRIGDVWSYSELVNNIDKDIVAGVSFLPKGDGLVAIDDTIASAGVPESLHSVTLVPGSYNNLLQLMTDHHVVVDVIRMPVDQVGEVFKLLGAVVPNLIGLYFLLNILYIIGGGGGGGGGGAGGGGFGRGSGRGSGRGMFQFGPKTDGGKEIDTSAVNTTFADVAGCDEAKTELLEVVDFLKNGDKYVGAGAKIPKGVLLEGSPGTGKTLMARAVAGEAGVPFLSASGSEFIEVFVGVGASRVRDLFERAKEKAPCVVFIDEIDAIGRQRGAGIAGGNDEREQTLNQILTNMDGFDITDGVIVIAATNRADILDNALTRPGRFDRKVNVPLPSLEGRKAIADVHFRNKIIGDDVSFDELATLTSGFSGAEIANLANEAAILQVRHNVSAIGRSTLLDAFEKVTIGLPSLSVETDADIVELVSYHETGHALMAALFPDFFVVRKVTINANRGGAGGYTLFTPVEKYNSYATKRFMLANLIVALGGRAAEVYLHRKDYKASGFDSYVFDGFKDLDITTGASNDLMQANRIAKSYVTQYGFGDAIGQYDESMNNEQPFVGRAMGMSSSGVSDSTKRSIDVEVNSLVEFAYKKALDLINVHEKSFLSIVDLLCENRTISGADITQILDEVSDDDC